MSRKVYMVEMSVEQYMTLAYCLEIAMSKTRSQAIRAKIKSLQETVEQGQLVTIPELPKKKQ